jgi:hypothetical protein
MTRPPDGELFKQAPSRKEFMQDATTKAAMQIIDKETAARLAKTEKLRSARLEKEAAEPPPAARKTRRKAQ